MPRTRIPIKNHHQEIQLVVNRSMLGLLAILLLILLLITRLGYLQVSKHSVYTTLATNNWMDLQPVEPTRGLIYDRNGILLAENIPVFSLDIIPSDVNNLEETIGDLKKIVSISDNDVAQFHKQLKQHRRFDEIPLKLRLSEKEVAIFSENQHRFKGVQIKARLIRYYPFGEGLSHILGYVGRINAQELNEIDQANYSANQYIGKQGIEKYYEGSLHGKVGYMQVENDASGKSVRSLDEIKANPGKNLYLTVDSGLQMAAVKALDGRRGAIVAIEPATGQILALVSEPSFDPNLFVAGMSQKEFNELQESPYRPLFNRAIKGLYPLASTIKPFLALKGLDADIITPDEKIHDPGYFEVSNGSHTYRDWLRYGHGYVNLDQAITISCDTYFYNLASRMGIRNIDAVLNQFGFGTRSGIDLEHEASGNVASPEWKLRAKGVRWYEGDTILSGIGQGFMQTTPLQLASATATLANRGQRFMPYLLMGEQRPNEQYEAQLPIALDSVQLNDTDNWDIVIDAMQDVIHANNGTGFRFGRNPPYSVAAKTGTAQVVGRQGGVDENIKQEDLPERLRDHHMFIAFAPVENPQIALAIVTENYNAAAVTARKIFDYYLGNANHAIRRSKTKTAQTRA